MIEDNKNGHNLDRLGMEDEVIKNIIAPKREEQIALANRSNEKGADSIEIEDEEITVNLNLPNEAFHKLINSEEVMDEEERDSQLMTISYEKYSS
jgi:hypothetical protein